MKSVRSRQFRELYAALPEGLQAKAIKSFRLWRNDSTHPSLEFKKVDEELNIWSARIDQAHRAVCHKRTVDGETRFVWTWIGNHDEYMRLINP